MAPLCGLLVTVQCHIMCSNTNTRHRNKRHSKLKRIADFVGFCYAFALGVTAIRIDFAKRQIHTSLALSAYVTGVNVAFLASMPLAVCAGVRYLPRNEPHSPAQYAQAFVLALSCVLMLWLLGRRRWRERQIKAIALELFALDACYFDRQPYEPAIERQFDVLFQLKLLSIGAQMATVCWLTLSATRVINGESLLLAAFLSQLHNVLHCVIFYYFYFMWHAYKRFCVLNVQLLQLLAGLQRHLNRLAACDLRELALVHGRLTRLVEQLNENNKYQTMAVLLWYLTHNVLCGYRAVMALSGGVDVTLGRLELVLYFCAFIVFFVDLNLFFWLSDGAVCAQREAAQTLRAFQALPLLDGALRQQCAIFAMQLKLRPLCIDVNGMFCLSKRSALAMCAYTLQRILFLVKCNFETQLRSAKK